MDHYIIGHRKYKADEANVICEWMEGDIFAGTTCKIYACGGKKFFLETAPFLKGSKIKELTRKEALALMDEHPAGIKEWTYRMTFGDPLEG